MFLRSAIEVRLIPLARLRFKRSTMSAAPSAYDSSTTSMNELRITHDSSRRPSILPLLRLALLASLAGCVSIITGDVPADPPFVPHVPSAPQAYDADGKARLSEPFRGISAEGRIVPGLFAIERSGVSTVPVRAAAQAFVDSLDSQGRARALVPIESDRWRRWSNIHRYPRQGRSLGEMTVGQREKAFALLRESLSIKGFETARDIMRLNATVGEMNGNRADYSEYHYWFSVLGTPSADQPWGWQLDGHHLNVNFFVLRDQVVMTPVFMGSEPAYAADGRYRGTRVFRDEEQAGLVLIRSLAPPQREKAVVSKTLPPEVFTAGFRDNVDLRYQGIRYGELPAAQQARLLALIETYVGRMRAGHARVRMEEVRRHLADTWFAWMGGFDDDSVFYYRVHSPVILIEFDHQRGVALPGSQPSRNHVHTVVRTPNGNDYGKDLLRQHHEEFHRGGVAHSH